MVSVMNTEQDPGRDALRRRTVRWVVGIATAGLLFDGYDLVVYGTVVSVFLRHPSEIGKVRSSN
jgi:AAHS family benzoate transporter-like MFS transporter